MSSGLKALQSDTFGMGTNWGDANGTGVTLGLNIIMDGYGTSSTTMGLDGQMFYGADGSQSESSPWKNQNLNAQGNSNSNSSLGF